MRMKYRRHIGNFCRGYPTREIHDELILCKTTGKNFMRIYFKPFLNDFSQTRYFSACRDTLYFNANRNRLPETVDFFDSTSIRITK